MDPNYLNIAVALLGFIIANILLGSVNSLFDKKFDVGKFFKGLGKGLIVIVTMTMIYFIGTLNPDIIKINMNGQEYTILSLIYTLMLGGCTFYGAQAFEKLYTLIKTKKD